MFTHTKCRWKELGVGREWCCRLVKKDEVEGGGAGGRAVAVRNFKSRPARES